MVRTNLDRPTNACIHLQRSAIYDDYVSLTACGLNKKEHYIVVSFCALVSIYYFRKKFGHLSQPCLISNCLLLPLNHIQGSRELLLRIDIPHVCAKPRVLIELYHCLLGIVECICQFLFFFSNKI